MDSITPSGDLIEFDPFIKALNAQSPPSITLPTADELAKKYSEIRKAVMEEYSLAEGNWALDKKNL